MSQTKKRKSDVHNEHDDVINSKREKWYDEEQKAKMLSAPDAAQTTTGRRSSFMSALMRVVSKSGIKEKTRSTSQLPAAQLSSGSKTHKENDHSFASETSQESDHIPAHQLKNNYGLRQFVQTGEAPQDNVEMDVTSSETFDTTSSASVLSMVTPCRAFQRDKPRRSSVRSMPETPSLVDSLVSSAVRRHASVSSSDQNLGTPSRRSRFSFRIFRSRQSVCDSPKTSSNNISFEPVAEADESQDANLPTPEEVTPKSKGGTLGRAASRIFGSSNRRNSVAISDDVFSVSMNATGENDCETPKNTTLSSNSSGSSGFKKVSSTWNMFRASTKTTPSPGRRSNAERSKMEKRDHRIRKAKDSRRSSLAPSVLNASAREIMEVQTREKERDLANLFRNSVRLSSQLIPDVLQNEEFDAVLVDLIDGKPASSTANAVLNYYSAAEGVKYAYDAIVENTQHVIYKQEGQPYLICINMDSQNMKPLEVRVRIGVGVGLREVWIRESIKRVLLYPAFCFNEEDQNNIKDSVQTFLGIVHKVLEWNKTPENIESVVLAGLSPSHAQLLKQQFQCFLSGLPPSDAQMADI